MTSTTALKVGAAYIRVSTDGQMDLSPESQLESIVQYAKSSRIVIPKEYIFMESEGRSGKKADNRPEFQRMIATAKTTPKPFDCILVWKFSRFARNQDESTFYKGMLRKKLGIDVISISEPVLDGMYGRLIEMIIEWQDEFYSDNLSDDVIRGMTQKALEHGYQTTPCLGYDAAGGGQPFVINEDQYRIVEYIHQSYHDGQDLARIARNANALGYRTRRGNLFDNRAVKLVLTNSFYIGLVRWRDHVFQGPHECRSSVTSLFADNQARLQREYRPRHRREVSSCRHWLSGILKCSSCGASLGYNRGSGRNPDFFQCWKYSKGMHSGSCCISVSKAEKTVLESFRVILETGEVEFSYTRKQDPETSSRETVLQGPPGSSGDKGAPDPGGLRRRDRYPGGI